MGAAIAYINEGKFANVTALWDKGYFFTDAFVPGKDNYAVLSEAVACLTNFTPTMAERHEAARSLSGYYTHITGKQVPQHLADKLAEWVRHEYDLAKYTFMSEERMQLIRTERETDRYEEDGGRD
ncbi:hypothetical protein [Paenibacillus tengchongensis]|uniref:hypothetical protein n=1 Tax=Paenibacillus tengchongensis TaxID=2608684 RepID=UPI00124F585E|nr:hypothetical protein [Paenibacillus tengchongensis]